MVRLRTRHGVLDRRERGAGVRPQLGLLDDAGLEGRPVDEGYGPDLPRARGRRQLEPRQLADRLRFKGNLGRGPWRAAYRLGALPPRDPDAVSVRFLSL